MICHDLCFASRNFPEIDAKKSYLSCSLTDFLSLTDDFRRRLAAFG